MSTPSAQFGFNRPFAEQADFFRQKLNVPTAAWDDIRYAAHDRAFVVAGAMQADLLADLREAVRKSIEDGQSIQEFRKQFDQIVKTRGWEGWTGSDSLAGRDWRTRVIYQTNMATSYAAGRYAQLTDPELLAVRPFWRYVHADGVAHPRPLHLAWGNAQLTLRHDHPFWKTHYPPNGWGCHCYVIAVRGPGPNDATVPPVGWDAVQLKTGELPGIDKGWGYAPGASVATDVRAAVTSKAATLPNELGAALRGVLDDVVGFEAPKVMRTVTALEAEIRTERVEHLAVISTEGEVLFRARGGVDQVTIPAAEESKLVDAIVMHNHPGWASFSEADIRSAAAHQVAEARLVDFGYRYTMRPPRGVRWDLLFWDATIKPAYDAAFTEVDAQWGAALEAGLISQDAFDEHFMDEVWRRVAMGTELRYRRRKLKELP